MLMVNCGYTYEYIDNHMTLPKLAALTKYWSAIPPIGTLLAGIALHVGYDYTKKAPTGDALLAQAKAEAAQFNQGARGG